MERLHVSMILAASIGWLALPLGAAAEDPPAGGPGRGACHADVQRLCQEAKGTPGGVGSCLREHRDELSEGCRAQIDARRSQARGRRAAFGEACSDDLSRLCTDVTPGRGGLARCLRQHESDLSDSCRAALPARGAGRGPQ